MQKWSKKKKVAVLIAFLSSFSSISISFSSTWSVTCGDEPGWQPTMVVGEMDTSSTSTRRRRHRLLDGVPRSLSLRRHRVTGSGKTSSVVRYRPKTSPTCMYITKHEPCWPRSTHWWRPSSQALCSRPPPRTPRPRATRRLPPQPSPRALPWPSSFPFPESIPPPKKKRRKKKGGGGGGSVTAATAQTVRVYSSCGGVAARTVPLSLNAVAACPSTCRSTCLPKLCSGTWESGLSVSSVLPPVQSRLSKTLGGGEVGVMKEAHSSLWHRWAEGRLRAARLASPRSTQYGGTTSGAWARTAG